MRSGRGLGFPAGCPSRAGVSFGCAPCASQASAIGALDRPTNIPRHRPKFPERWNTDDAGENGGRAGSVEGGLATLPEPLPWPVSVSVCGAAICSFFMGFSVRLQWLVGWAIQQVSASSGSLRYQHIEASDKKLRARNGSPAQQKFATKTGVDTPAVRGAREARISSARKHPVRC